MASYWPSSSFAQPGVEVAAQGFNLQVRAQRTQQHHTAQAGGANHRTVGQRGEVGIAHRHQRVTRVFAQHDAGEAKALGQFHRHVFERVHGEVGPAFVERGFELLDKQAFAADFAQGPVQDLVALGGHAEQFNPVALGLQQVAHMPGLPQRQPALTGGNYKVLGRGHARSGVSAVVGVQIWRGC